MTLLYLRLHQHFVALLVALFHKVLFFVIESSLATSLQIVSINFVTHVLVSVVHYLRNGYRNSIFLI